MNANWKDIKLWMMDISYSSSVDGTGFRDVLFVTGCPHHCPGCQNPETWEMEKGHLTPLGEVYDKLMHSDITNITYSGGEPFQQAAALAALTREIRAHSKKTIWVYSGYLFEALAADPEKRQLLELCDVLVDGRFEQEKTQLNLRFRGSTNQRFIDISASLAAGKAVLYDLDF